MSHYQEAERVFREEIAALGHVLVQIEPDFDAAIERCLQCTGKLVVCGIGKSGIIGHKIAATLASTGTPAVFLNAGEALHGDMGVVSESDVVIMLSNSATTPELARMVPSVRRIGAQMIGVFGNTETALAREMDVVLNIAIEREACPLNLAPMSSSTATLVVGDAIASALMRAKGFSQEDFAVFHPGGTLGRRLLFRVQDVMQPLSKIPIIRPDISLDQAIHALGEGRLGAVLICDEVKQLLGILVEADVRRHYLKQTAPDSPISQAMTANPKCIRPDALLGEALEQMENQDRQVYVLPVVDSENRVLGLIRMHDIIST